MLEPSEEGGFISYIAEFPGANSQGDTREEATEMVLEVLSELLEINRQEAIARLAPRAELVATELVAA